MDVFFYRNGIDSRVRYITKRTDKSTNFQFRKETVKFEWSRTFQETTQLKTVLKYFSSPEDISVSIEGLKFSSCGEIVCLSLFFLSSSKYVNKLLITTEVTVRIVDAF
jgi:hypothetical protein